MEGHIDGTRDERRLRLATVETDRPRIDRVDPKMRLAPRITRKRGADGILRFGLDGVYHTVLIVERPAQNDEARVDETVHEGRMLGPAGLLLQRPRGVPLRARAAQHDEKHRHLCVLPTAEVLRAARRTPYCGNLATHSRKAKVLEAMPPKQIRPKSLADYLEVLSKIAFEAGLSWRVVDAKWDEIRKAFHGFDPDRVARMTPRAVDKLVADERVIRSRTKIEATIANAETMLELADEYKGFKRYLRSQADFEATVKDLRKRFKFLGDHGAYRFLWIVGETVPSYEDWTRSRGMETAMPRGRRHREH